MRGDEKRKLESGQISKLLNSCRKQSPTQAVGKQKTNSKKYTTGQSRPQAKTLLKSLSIQIPASYSYAAQLDIHHEWASGMGLEVELGTTAGRTVLLYILSRSSTL